MFAIIETALCNTDYKKLVTGVAFSLGIEDVILKG